MRKEPQIELFGAPEPADPNVAWLERTLTVVGDWMLAKELANASGGRLSDRDVRLLAEGSDCVISGQRGYKHLDRATAEEISRFVAWMESQGKKMIGRAERIRRHAHGRIG